MHIEFAAALHIHATTAPDGGVIGDAAAVHGKGAVIPHPYAAASPRGVITAGSGVAGDAAAVHDEIAASMKTHAVSKERWIVGDPAAILTVGQGKGRRIAFRRFPDIKRISIIYNRNGVAIQTESDITIDIDAPDFI